MSGEAKTPDKVKLTKAQLEVLKLIDRAPYLEIRDGNIRRIANRLVDAGLCKPFGGPRDGGAEIRTHPFRPLCPSRRR